MQTHQAGSRLAAEMRRRVAARPLLLVGATGREAAETAGTGKETPRRWAAGKATAAGATELGELAASVVGILVARIIHQPGSFNFYLL